MFMGIVTKIIPEIRALAICGFAYHVALMPRRRRKYHARMRLPEYLVVSDFALGRNSSSFDQSRH